MLFKWTGYSYGWIISLSYLYVRDDMPANFSLFQWNNILIDI